MTTSTTARPAGAPDVDVVVVGGGIGGLASALALDRTGRRVRVLEQASTFGEVGAGLQMAPNATRVLRSWGLLDEVVSHGVVPRRLVMRDALDGAELPHLDLADARTRYDAPYVVIHRSDLHAILLRACRSAGVDLVTDAAVTGVEIADDDAAALGEHRRDVGRVLLAADGLNSRLRRRLSDDEPISSAYVAYRGAVPLDHMADTSGLALDDVTFYVGPYCHLVQYPLRSGSMFNQVAVFRSPRAMAGESTWGTPDELDAAFAGTCEPVRKALGELWRDRWWQMYDREPIPTWVDRRLALIGGAAHPMLQTSPRAPARRSRTPTRSPPWSRSTISDRPSRTGTPRCAITPTPGCRAPRASRALPGRGVSSGTARDECRKTTGIGAAAPQDGARGRTSVQRRRRPGCAMPTLLFKEEIRACGTTMIPTTASRSTSSSSDRASAGSAPPPRLPAPEPSSRSSRSST